MCERTGQKAGFISHPETLGTNLSSPELPQVMIIFKNKRQNSLLSCDNQDNSIKTDISGNNLGCSWLTYSSETNVISVQYSAV